MVDGVANPPFSCLYTNSAYSNDAFSVSPPFTVRHRERNDQNRYFVAFSVLCARFANLLESRPFLDYQPCTGKGRVGLLPFIRKSFAIAALWQDRLTGSYECKSDGRLMAKPPFVCSIVGGSGRGDRRALDEKIEKEKRTDAGAIGKVRCLQLSLPGIPYQREFQFHQRTKSINMRGRMMIGA